jgi:hypothetical protein
MCSTKTICAPITSPDPLVNASLPLHLLLFYFIMAVFRVSIACDDVWGYWLLGQKTGTAEY